jgi:hypothetical protein
MKHGVTILTIGRVSMGTQQAVSLQRRYMAEDETGRTEICMTSFAVEMCATRFKIGIRSVSALNRSSMKKGTMTTAVPIMTNLTNSILLNGGHNAGGVKAFSQDLKRVHWPSELQTIGNREV